MPIYEYECPKCGLFETIQKASDKVLKAKPECDRKDCPKCAERIISHSAFHLKGGGWYKNDYASSSSSSTSKKTKTDASSTSTSDSSASKESSDKPEKKSLAKADGGTGSGSGGCGSGCGCH